MGGVRDHKRELALGVGERKLPGLAVIVRDVESAAGSVEGGGAYGVWGHRVGAGRQIHELVGEAAVGRAEDVAVLGLKVAVGVGAVEEDTAEATVAGVKDWGAAGSPGLAAIEGLQVKEVGGVDAGKEVVGLRGVLRQVERPGRAVDGELEGVPGCATVAALQDAGGGHGIDSVGLGGGGGERNDAAEWRGCAVRLAGKDDLPGESIVDALEDAVVGSGVPERGAEGSARIVLGVPEGRLLSGDQVRPSSLVTAK